jgi:glucosamine--fructose-6-phosphate aminotransferase (isomerizing)
MIASSEPRDALPVEALAPDGPDAMGRETAEGPAAVEATLVAVGVAPRRLVSDARRVLLVGTGASLAVAEAAAPLFGGQAIVREASSIALALAPGQGVDGLAIVVSNSGRSPETLAAARAIASAGRPVVAVTSDAGSPLAAGAAAVVATPVGEETGAATKSEVAAFAALAALAGAVATRPDQVGALRSRLETTVADLGPALVAGRLVARTTHRWAIGFDGAFGLARATALLLHEKARLPTVFCSPSEFRHGPIEAATDGDVVVLLDPSPAPEGSRAWAYRERLTSELADLGTPLIRVAPDPTAALPLPAALGPAEATLHAFVRAQQLARVAAHASGAYLEEFRVLRAVVRAADDLLD